VRPTPDLGLTGDRIWNKQSPIELSVGRNKPKALEFQGNAVLGYRSRGGLDMEDRGPTVINTGGGNGGWAVAVVLAVVAIGALLLFTGVIDIHGGKGGGGTSVTVHAPAVEAPAAEKPAASPEKPAAPAAQ